MDLSNFDVLMLDLNGTFMFGQDRFGSDQDYFATYHLLGGTDLDAGVVTMIVEYVLDLMWSQHEDPEFHECFPSVREALERSSSEASLTAYQRAKLEQVIAHHEMGRISEENVQALHSLALKKRLVLVSNIWSKKDQWIAYFAELGIGGLLETIVFSSDHAFIKPSPAIYRVALDAADVLPERVLFVGDDPVCDIALPRSFGMGTARIRGNEKEIGEEADIILDRLSDLAILLD